MLSFVNNDDFKIIENMNGNECELIRHCIDTDEYSTVKISQQYVLIHRTIARNQIDFGTI